MFTLICYKSNIFNYNKILQIDRFKLNININYKQEIQSIYRNNIWIILYYI